MTPLKPKIILSPKKKKKKIKKFRNSVSGASTRSKTSTRTNKCSFYLGNCRGFKSSIPGTRHRDQYIYFLFLHLHAKYYFSEKKKKTNTQTQGNFCLYVCVCVCVLRTDLMFVCLFLLVGGQSPHNTVVVSVIH